jgi:hypothetical protein
VGWWVRVCFRDRVDKLEVEVGEGISRRGKQGRLHEVKKPSRGWVCAPCSEWSVFQLGVAQLNVYV